MKSNYLIIIAVVIVFLILISKNTENFSNISDYIVTPAYPDSGYALDVPFQNVENDIPPFEAYQPMESPSDPRYIYFSEQNVYLLPFDQLDFTFPYHRWMYYYYPAFYGQYYRNNWPFKSAWGYGPYYYGGYYGGDYGGDFSGYYGDYNRDYNYPRNSPYLPRTKTSLQTAHYDSHTYPNKQTGFAGGQYSQRFSSGISPKNYIGGKKYDGSTYSSKKNSRSREHFTKLTNEYAGIAHTNFDDNFDGKLNPPFSCNTQVATGVEQLRGCINKIEPEIASRGGNASRPRTNKLVEGFSTTGLFVSTDANTCMPPVYGQMTFNDKNGDSHIKTDKYGYPISDSMNDNFGYPIPKELLGKPVQQGYETSNGYPVQYGYETGNGYPVQYGYETSNGYPGQPSYSGQYASDAGYPAQYGSEVYRQEYPSLALDMEDPEYVRRHEKMLWEQAYRQQQKDLANGYTPYPTASGYPPYPTYPASEVPLGVSPQGVLLPIDADNGPSPTDVTRPINLNPNNNQPITPINTPYSLNPPTQLDYPAENNRYVVNKPTAPTIDNKTAPPSIVPSMIDVSMIETETPAFGVDSAPTVAFGNVVSSVEHFRNIIPHDTHGTSYARY